MSGSKSKLRDQPDMLNERQRFLRIKKPEYDESLWGFLLRLTEANFLGSPYWITQLTELKKGFRKPRFVFLTEESSEMQVLSVLTGLTVSEVLALAYPPSIGRSLKVKRLMLGHSVPKDMIWAHYLKICPGCLRDFQYCRKIWDLAAVTCCPIHWCLLVDRCPNCTKLIPQNRKSVSICCCNFDWREIQSPRLDKSELKIARHIHALCELPIGDVPNDSSRIIPPLSSLNLDSFITALFFMLLQYDRISQNRQSQFCHLGTAQVHSLLIQVPNVFEDWPNRFYEFLETRAKPKGKFRRSTPSIGKTLSRIYDLLYARDSENQLAFIRYALEEYSITWEKGKIDSRTRISKAVSDRKQYLSKTETSQKLSISCNLVTTLINQGVLEAKTIASETLHGETRLISRESVENYKTSVNSRLNGVAIANLLDITKQSVYSLIKFKYLVPLFNPANNRGRWAFGHSAADELVYRIRCTMEEDPAISKENMVSLNEVPISVVNLIGAILAGKIRPRAIGAKQGLNQFLFSKQDISNLRCRRRPMQRIRYEQKSIRRNGNLSSGEAAKQLGIKREALSFLVKNGFIEAHTGAFGRALIPEQSINSFNDSYWFLARLASNFNIVHKKLKKILAANGIHPISGLSVNGGYEYLYKKSELDSIDIELLIDEANYRYWTEKEGLLTAEQVASLIKCDLRKIYQLVKNGTLKPKWTATGRNGKPDVYLFRPRPVKEYIKRRADVWTHFIRQPID